MSDQWVDVLRWVLSGGLVVLSGGVVKVLADYRAMRLALTRTQAVVVNAGKLDDVTLMERVQGLIGATIDEAKESAEWARREAANARTEAANARAEVQGMRVSLADTADRLTHMTARLSAAETHMGVLESLMRGNGITVPPRPAELNDFTVHITNGGVAA